MSQRLEFSLQLCFLPASPLETEALGEGDNTVWPEGGLSACCVLSPNRDPRGSRKGKNVPCESTEGLVVRRKWGAGRSVHRVRVAH